jgi:hypothetical protein
MDGLAHDLPACCYLVVIVPAAGHIPQVSHTVAIYNTERPAHRDILHGGPIEGKHIGIFSMVDQ